VVLLSRAGEKSCVTTTFVVDLRFPSNLQCKELATADPIVDIYNRRCGIRSEKSRGSITEEIAAKAKELALEHKLHAQEDPQYANTQYPLDMAQKALYEEARRHLPYTPTSAPCAPDTRCRAAMRINNFGRSCGNTHSMGIGVMKTP